MAGLSFQDFYYIGSFTMLSVFSAMLIANVLIQLSQKKFNIKNVLINAVGMTAIIFIVHVVIVLIRSV
ncbi:hypothetical protein CHH75_00310 [Paenibacillus sp. 7541]|uniref:DUF2768 family protein n=1 Tax=Paenibacillus campinasensis TaxID=66347 RepID=A0A268ENM5_9BACL|nr:hypothetical protein CHH67_17155 [Paenibacillus campinasensis]PAK55751.1 hypothetical protein CHH75_00310 [Paenibacillus sp. 7541]